MDRGPGVTPASVTAEQAIFTSVRGPTGEGYRLIAASPGLRAEEKAEIPRWCPSHGSLCDASPSAEALAVMRLSTGRLCIGWSRHAGVEHTGRGGQRVHTHLAILDAGGYAAFGHCPVRVRDALARAVPGEPQLKPPAALPALELAPGARTQLASALSFSRIEPPQVCALATLMLAGKRVVLAGVRRPAETVEWLSECLPFSARSTLSLTVGLAYSPSRRVQLACIGPETPEVRRAVAGQDLLLIDASQGLTPEGGYEPWTAVIQRLWSESRFDDLRQLTGDPGIPATAESLGYVARLRTALDLVATAEARRLVEIQGICEEAGPETPLIRRMHDELQAGACKRAEQLAKQRKTQVTPLGAKV